MAKKVKSGPKKLSPLEIQRNRQRESKKTLNWILKQKRQAEDNDRRS